MYTTIFLDDPLSKTKNSVVAAIAWRSPIRGHGHILTSWRKKIHFVRLCSFDQCLIIIIGIFTFVADYTAPDSAI